MKFLLNFLHPILKLYAWKNNIDYYNFDNDFEKFGKDFIQNFIQKTEVKKYLLPLIRKEIAKINSLEINSKIKYQKIYDLEYGESNYGFLNALLVNKLFESITGISQIKFRSLTIIDVGVGSGELEIFLMSIGCLNFSIFCVDTSSTSIERIKKIGLQGYVGTLNEANIRNDSFDVTFLSYFIEYDISQNDTFYNAVRITKSDGKIVLEAFLPAHIKFIRNNKTISRGYSLIGDINRIKRNFFTHAKKLNKDCKLEKISIGHRWVFSHHGLCKLPSIFLTFKVKSS